MASFHRDNRQQTAVAMRLCKRKRNLTHWGRVTHICVENLISIASDNGLSPGRRQTIIWTNAGILLIGPLGTSFSEILSEIRTFLFKKLHLKTSCANWRLFCLGLNELIWGALLTHLPRRRLASEQHLFFICSGTIYIYIFYLQIALHFSAYEHKIARIIHHNYIK